MKPIHPGEILAEEFLKPSNISQYRLAKDTGIHRMTYAHIIRGDRSISGATALKLAEYFKNSPEFWMNLQSHYDLAKARLKLKK